MIIILFELKQIPLEFSFVIGPVIRLGYDSSYGFWQENRTLVQLEKELTLF